MVLPSIGEIPLGATIDTRNGRIQLRFETEDGKVQTATFYGGIFQIRQVGKILDLKLTEPLAACPKKGKAAAAQTKKAKKRKLWGDGKGAFRTTGKYSAATVRGTKWLVEDSCAGTLTRVTSGVWRFAPERRPCSSGPGSGTWPSRANCCPIGLVRHLTLRLGSVGGLACSVHRTDNGAACAPHRRRRRR